MARALSLRFIFTLRCTVYFGKKDTKSGLFIRGRAHGRSLTRFLDLFAHHPLELQCTSHPHSCCSVRDWPSCCPARALRLLPALSYRHRAPWSRQPTRASIAAFSWHCQPSSTGRAIRWPRRAVVSAIAADALVHVPARVGNGGVVNGGRITVS